MSEPLTEYQLERLSYFLKDNKYAMKFCLDILWTGQLWDDLIDGDNPRPAEDVNAAFLKAFRDIPNNAWFASLPSPFKQQLEGLIISAAMQYRDSTKLELGNEDDRFMALLIRNSSLSIAHYCIGLLGGEDWLDENSLEFWQLFGLKNEYLNFVAEGNSEVSV